MKMVRVSLKIISKPIKLYSQAAENGYAGAQYNLALMHYNGIGVPQDYVKAYIWCAMAADNGHSAGKNYLTLITSNMKTNELKNAQKQLLALNKATTP